MDKETLARVSKAITETPNASDYEVLVARNAVKALLTNSYEMLANFDGLMLDDFQSIIKFILGEK